jgi:hypothetical protein
MSEDRGTETPSGNNPNAMVSDGVGADGSVGEPTPTPNWREFIDGLEKLNTNLGGRLDGIKEVVTENTRPQPAPAAPVDYEGMSNVELVAHVTGNVQRIVQEAIQQALKPVVDQVNGVQNDLVTTRGELSLKEMRAQHKDFADWKGEMIDLVGKHPTLGLREVYMLAKAGDPGKAKQLDLKYNPPPPKPRPFGGLTPSGNGKASEPVLSGEAATRAAYNEVMARHPGILPILQDL